jgi:hypothetical protein
MPATAQLEETVRTKQCQTSVTYAMVWHRRDGRRVCLRQKNPPINVRPDLEPDLGLHSVDIHK